MNLLMLGQITLGVYALLLAVGGVIGYVKAQSKPSLIAGIGSGILALACEKLTTVNPTAGLGLGALLALLMLVMFSMRFAKSRKFMPSGMLGAVSLVVVVILAVAAVQVRT
jgi:uncharacterized membrane protein (UPF0136 family)